VIFFDALHRSHFLATDAIPRWVYWSVTSRQRKWDREHYLIRLKPLTAWLRSGPKFGSNGPHNEAGTNTMSGSFVCESRFFWKIIFIKKYIFKNKLNFIFDRLFAKVDFIFYIWKIFFNICLHYKNKLKNNLLILFFKFIKKIRIKNDRWKN
jgi:hypothetical protein